jgi:two-component system, OmpR family, sensor histidine kinase KdpD
VSGAIVSSEPQRGRVGTVTGEYLGAAALVGLTTAIGLVFRSRLGTTDVAMLFLLAVVASATRYRRGAALFASILGIAAFDFVFVPPYYTFDVHDTAFLLTFTVMLLDLDRELAGSRAREELARVVARHVGRAAHGEAVVVFVDETNLEDGIPNWPSNELFESTEMRVAATWAYQHGEPAGLGTGHCGEAEAVLIPLRMATGSLGVVALCPEPAGRRLTNEEYEAAVALGSQAAVAIERTILSEQSEAARVEAEAERLRTSLLSSLSHDLRTPLATIEGAASTIMQHGGTLPPEVRHDMAESILEESRRMSRLVSNLLDMIRVETGALAVQKAWQPLEEALGVALLRLDASLGSHPVDVRLPADLPLVAIDELLIEQVFINLLENAIKYTPPGTPISVGAWQGNGAIVVEVADGGPGVAPGSEETVFRKFYRAGSGPEGGAGLGLTICRGIVTAHGGRIWVEPRSGGGAAFRFTLPLDGPPLLDLPQEATD